MWADRAALWPRMRRPSGASSQVDRWVPLRTQACRIEFGPSAQTSEYNDLLQLNDPGSEANLGIKSAKAAPCGCERAHGVVADGGPDTNARQGDTFSIYESDRLM